MEQYVNITWYQLLLFMTACAFVVAGFSLFYVWYDGRIAKKERDERRQYLQELDDAWRELEMR